MKKSSKNKPKPKLRKYGLAGETPKIKPYLTEDPNDPRLRNYNDSLLLNKRSDTLYSGIKDNKIDAKFQAEQAQKYWQNNSPAVKAYNRLSKQKAGYEPDYESRPLLVNTAKDKVSTDHVYAAHYPAPKQEVKLIPKPNITNVKADSIPTANNVTNINTAPPTPVADTMSYGRSPIGQPYSQMGQKKTWLTQGESDKIPYFQHKYGGRQLPRFDTAGTMPGQEPWSIDKSQDTRMMRQGAPVASAADQEAIDNSNNNNTNANQYAKSASSLASVGSSFSRAYNNTEGNVGEKRIAGTESGVESGLSSGTGWYAAAKGLSDTGKSFVPRNEDGTAKTKTGALASRQMTATHTQALNSVKEGNYGMAAANLLGMGNVMNMYGNVDNKTSFGKWTNKQLEEDHQYALGGVTDGQPNGEIETIETMNTAPGVIQAGKYPTHAMGGQDVNLPTGTKMLSDRIKNPETGNTFAKDGNKYTTKSEDKVKDNINSTGVAKFTANLKSQVKQRMHDALFNSQEAIKQSKIMKYAQKLGHNLNPNAFGGIQDTDSFKGEDIEYKSGGIHIDPSKKGTFTAAATKHGESVQGFASKVLANKENYSPAMVKKANFARNAAKWHHAEGGVHELPKFYGAGEYSDRTGSYDSRGYQTAGPMGQGLTKDILPEDPSMRPFTDYSEPSSMIEEYRSSNPELYDTSKLPEKKKTPYDYSNAKDALGLGANIIGQNVGNIADLWMTRGGKKYDKENSGQLSPHYLSAAEELRAADIEANASRKSLKDMTQGNVGAYLANLGSTQTQNALTKAKIKESIDNINLGKSDAYDQLNQRTRMLDKSNEQQNKARSEDIARTALRGIGQTTAGASRDYKAGKMDQYSLDLIAKAYPDYEYDKTKKGWYHKKTKEKLEAK